MKRYAKRKGLSPPRWPKDAPPLYPEEDSGYMKGSIHGAYKRFVDSADPAFEGYLDFWGERFTAKKGGRKKVTRKKTTRSLATSCTSARKKATRKKKPSIAQLKREYREAKMAYFKAKRAYERAKIQL
jgi:hypothetical protein